MPIPRLCVDLLQSRNLLARPLSHRPGPGIPVTRKPDVEIHHLSLTSHPAYAMLSHAVNAPNHDRTHKCRGS